MIKNRFAIVGAYSCALLACSPASANYLGVGVRLHTTVNVDGTPLSVWRMYALFSNPNDYLTAVAGSSVVGAMQIESRNATDTAAGGNFFNAGTSKMSPKFDNGQWEAPNAEWDTFPTIGLAVDVDGENECGVSPGFPSYIAGNSLSSINIGWFGGPYEIGRAGGPQGLVQSVWLNSGVPVAGANGAYGVLFTQLTVNAGDNVRGTVSISGINAGALAAVFTSNGQTFNSIPTPGAMGLLALAAMIRSRRRSS